jgi:hypothetical protein
VVGQAEASVSPQEALKAAAEKSARVIRGDDEDDVGSGNEKVTSGAKRWRDTGVYVDGKPTGVLSFGELPISLKPTFKMEKASAEMEPGQKNGGFKWIKQRHYRFDDYFKSLGVDLKRVKEVHVYGPKFTDSLVVSGRDVIKRGKEFLFRFGSDVGGKAIPVCPEKFGNGRTPDKITAVMVYVEKKPPTLVWNVGFQLDGGPTIKDVPYYGAPIRGGIRVYQDDKLSFIIKRPLLRATDPAGRNADGTPYWKLGQILEANGIDKSQMVEAWLIANERREHKLTAEEISKVTFEMAEKGQNEIYIGEKKLKATAIAIHARALSASDLPHILPDEE